MLKAWKSITKHKTNNWILSVSHSQILSIIYFKWLQESYSDFACLKLGGSDMNVLCCLTQVDISIRKYKLNPYISIAYPSFDLKPKCLWWNGLVVSFWSGTECCHFVFVWLCGRLTQHIKLHSSPNLSVGYSYWGLISFIFFSLRMLQGLQGCTLVLYLGFYSCSGKQDVRNKMICTMSVKLPVKIHQAL